MAWENLMSALGGALLTFGITVYGRREARRDAREARNLALEDETRHRLEDEARQAAEAILDGLEERFSLRAESFEDDEYYEKADQVVRLMYHQAIYLPNPVLRERVNEAAEFLDFRIPLASVGLDLRELVYVVRRSMHDTLGAWLRGEELPDLRPRYLAVQAKYQPIKASYTTRSKHRPLPS